MNEVDARQILAVPETTTPKELKRAYRRTLKTSHPDLFETDSPARLEAVERTRRVIEAFELLSGLSAPRKDRAAVDPRIELYRRSSRRDAVLIWGTLVLLVIVAAVVEFLR